MLFGFLMANEIDMRAGLDAERSFKLGRNENYVNKTSFVFLLLIEHFLFANFFLKLLLYVVTINRQILILNNIRVTLLAFFSFFRIYDQWILRLRSVTVTLMRCCS